MIYSDGNLIVGIIVGSDQTIGCAHPQTFSIRVTNNNTLGLIGELMLLTRLGQVDQSIKWLVKVGIIIGIITILRAITNLLGKTGLICQIPRQSVS